MKRLILVLLIIYSSMAAAKITAKLNDDKVSPGQTFQLILTEDDLSTQGIPDLTPLQKDFDIIGTERRVSQIISNGQIDSVSQWIIHLRAKEIGTFQIPEIQIGQNSSKPLTIDVVPASSQQSNQQQNDTTTQQPNDPIILSTSVSTDSPYVQQEVIYNVKIFSRERIINSEYQPPQINHALLVALGKSASRQEIINGVPYIVEELSYAIFPQQSGPITIRPPVFRAVIYDGIPEQVNVSDKPVELKVKGIPASYKAKNWLPANDVKLSESYEETSAGLKQGETLTRHITIKAEGAPAQLLPELEQDEDHPDYSSYPEKISEHNSIKGHVILGIAKRKITYLLNKSGQVTLPEVRLNWFNTNTQREEVAVLPSKTIEVAAGDTIQSQQETPTVTKSEKNNQVKEVTKKTPSEHSPGQPLLPWILVAVFASAWVFTTFIWFRFKNQNRSGNKIQKQAIQELKQACHSHQARAAAEALMRWGRYRWPEDQPLNLNELSRRCKSQRLKQALQTLSKHLYSTDTSNAWQGDELWQAFSGYKRKPKQKQSPKNPLPPINP